MISGQLAEISSVTFDGSFAWIGPEIKENVVQMNMIEKFVNSSGLMCGLLVKRKEKKLCLFVTISIKKK